MIGLLQTHAAFAHALRDAEAAVPRSIVARATEMATRGRFNVYRNNVYASLVGVLETRFPAVQRLLGEDFFNAMARIFVDQTPPRSPILLYYGREFPEFLATFEPAEDEPYLADVALLEWRMHAARHAADCDALTGVEVARRIDEANGDVVLAFVPAISLVVSPYPVFSLWRANTADPSEPYPQSFSGSEGVLVTRPALAPEAVRLPNGCGEFISALARGESLQTAAVDALAVASDFSIQRAVALLVAQRTIRSVASASQRGTP